MSNEVSKKSMDETIESWRVTGQELMEFVLKTSESLNNVINKARMASMQSVKTKKIVKRKSHPKSDNKNKSNNIKKFRFSPNTETSVETNSVTEVPTRSSIDFDFDWTSSSCEELNDIPMEELLSSPIWKQIVKQNEFVWP